MAIISRTQWKLTFIYNILISRHRLIKSDLNVSASKADTKCLNSGLLKRKCYCYDNEHYEFVTVRCHKYLYCRPCSNYRRNKWWWNCMRRFQQLAPQPKKIRLWTLGSSLSIHQFSQFRDHWIRFRKKINIDAKRKGMRWEPLFYVYELTKGLGTYTELNYPRIHIHLIVDGFLRHQFIRKHWKTKDGKFSHVNFVPSKQMKKVGKAFGYCIKYLSKEFDGKVARGYYMGRLLKAKIDDYTTKIIITREGKEIIKYIKVSSIEPKICEGGTEFKGIEITTPPIDPRTDLQLYQSSLEL